MLGWVLVVLLIIPLIDALFLAYLATAVLGWPATIAVVVLTALVGLLVVRAEGRRTMRKIQRALASGKTPTNEMLDGGLLVIAGVLLVTPGVVTDGIGLLLTLPPTRIPIRMALKKYVIIPYADQKTGGFVTGQAYQSTGTGDGVTIEFEDETDESNP